MSSYLKQLKKTDKSVLPPEPKKRSGNFEEKYVHPEFSEEIPEHLSDIESQIKKLNGKVWECAWLIGKRLIVVREQFLDGTEFTNISEYAKARFGFSHTTTVRFIYLANHFKKSSVLNFGSKLYLLSKLDDENRQKYLDWMKEDNPSYQTIEERVKSEFKKQGRPKKDINLTKTEIKIDLRKMGLSINKEKSDEFLKELEALVRKFAE